MLAELWHVVVHSRLRADVNGVAGQAAGVELVVRGDRQPRAANFGVEYSIWNTWASESRARVVQHRDRGASDDRELFGKSQDTCARTAGTIDRPNRPLETTAVPENFICKNRERDFE